MAWPSGETVKAYVEVLFLILDRFGSWIQRNIPRFLAGAFCALAALWAYFPDLLDPENGQWVTGKEQLSRIRVELGNAMKMIDDLERDIKTKDDELEDLTKRNIELNRKVSNLENLQAIKIDSAFEVYSFLTGKNLYVLESDSGGRRVYVEFDRTPLLEAFKDDPTAMRMITPFAVTESILSP